MPPTSERPPGPDNRVANQAMDRYADGDTSAFPILYDAIAPRIEGFVKRRTRDASRASRAARWKCCVASVSSCMDG